MNKLALHKGIIATICLGLVILLGGCVQTSSLHNQTVPPLATDAQTPQITSTPSPSTTLTPIPTLPPVQTNTTPPKEVTWGMLKDEVKDIIQADVDDGDFLIQVGTACGIKCNNVFKFDNEEKLVQVSVIFSLEHISTKRYIQDYVKVKTSLIEKYGEPSSDSKLEIDTVWDDLEYELMVGDSILNCSWELERTKIFLIYLVENFLDDSLSVTYRPIDYTPPINTDGI